MDTPSISRKIKNKNPRLQKFPLPMDMFPLKMVIFGAEKLTNYDISSLTPLI